MNSNPTFLRFTTAHYTFEMTVIESHLPYHSFKFFVGDVEKPCLEGHIILKNNSKNSRLNSVENTASLMNIKALQECSLDDITDNYMAQYSFGTELLESFIYFVNSQFPSIKTVSLNDASYIPCIKGDVETLDLLAYSVALYKETWYEKKLHAYLKPKELYEKYRKYVETYASQDTKDKMTFQDMYEIMLHGSEFTKIMIANNYTQYEELFNNSTTLPDYFKALNATIKRSEKCRFFKNWLEAFINKSFNIPRTWYFDLFPKIEEIKILSKRRNTRKNMSRK